MPANPPGPPPPILPFPSAQAFRTWLQKNHTQLTGIWLQLYKKGSGVESLTYDEALDEALCFGWIDGQKKSHDALSWLQKFTPRRPKSVWSQRNQAHVARLIQAKRMRPAGLREIEAAKTDGRWAQAYASQRTMEIPRDLLDALAKNKKAEAFFKSLNKTNLYAITWRLATAKKPETRQKRLLAILAMLSAGKKWH